MPLQYVLYTKQGNETFYLMQTENDTKDNNIAYTEDINKAKTYKRAETALQDSNVYNMLIGTL